jgi:hypothetical protein
LTLLQVAEDMKVGDHKLDEISDEVEAQDRQEIEEAFF